MGNGFGSIESVLHELFALANDEVIIVAYAMSSAAQMFSNKLNSYWNAAFA